MKKFVLSLAFAVLASTPTWAQNTETVTMTQFATMCDDARWQAVFQDDCTGDWRAKWFLDGDTSQVENTPEGMVLTSGTNLKDNGDSMVLWTRDSFAGDAKITYDYTRLDELTSNVCILYFQATGKGEAPYVTDIREWANLRHRAQMSLYFRNMNALHISYAVNRFDVEGEYVRARRYPVPEGGNFNRDTEIQGTYFDTKLFRPGITYHFTVVKRNETMFFRVQGDGQDRLFQWSLTDFPPLAGGRVGLRQMPGRQSRYTNFQVWTLPAEK